MGSVLGFPGADPADAAIGARLRRWRDQRGVDLEAMAQALHIPSEEMRLVEAGRAHLDSVQLGVATRHLRLPVWALVSDTRAY